MTQLYRQQRCQAMPDWGFSLDTDGVVTDDGGDGIDGDSMDCGISW